MYHNQPPPFQPPPGGVPPFPPNFQPGVPPPGGFPPFRPPNAALGFVPPPFPPTLSPAGGDGSPGGFRPPPNGFGFGPRPGLGAVPGASSSSSSGATPGFVREVKTTSVFVGGIAPGITDQTLKDLLNACGPLHELKRVSGANGKPQAFGFALFENPEVVMRAIRCLNGVELPDMTPEGRRDSKRKPLVVKVDEKTREFLEEFESTLGRSEGDEEADSHCRKAIQHIVALLTDPNATPLAGFGPGRGPGGRSPIAVDVPAHLRDLQEGDLPEEQRVVVLDQIAIFRETAARREREKKALEDEKERFKREQQRQGPISPANARKEPSSNYGYGNRVMAKEAQAAQAERQRQWGQTQNDSQKENGKDGRRESRDPQGYDKPVNFVKPRQVEGKGESERTDEEEEEMRKQRRDRERDHAFRDQERKVENRERHRIENLNREMSHRKQQADFEDRNRRRLTEMLENWDDEEIAEKGRESFYADRSRWRAQRQKVRQREFQDDLRDRHREEEERRTLEAESEEFLKRQMAEMAELEEKQKAAGLLTEDAAPIRLAINALPKEVKEEKKPDVVPPKPGIAFGGDDDDEDEKEKKKKRTLVKLEYEGDGLTEAEKIAQRNAKLLEIKRDVPRDRRALYAMAIQWAAIPESMMSTKIMSFIQSKMKDLLGEVDQDLADFVLEHLRERKKAADLIDGLEPIFADEATEFVTALWRQLAFESLAWASGLETGPMLV
ncbi:hypothetical protein BD324DRAFT_632974 [Kockovaella imperatae]|uniref:PWI domain-containing protein n=1 Tax=Kockovaella imperatae TaxID=4999 RepID=A0A1Y1UBQ7_9TREE|nr:hypothetical protein BD324DRAFT_632974 [Kockovaella imperatae]ORX35471.1 hypothetical protein BD324DRAFT_632974 [Kockovaella imperatae]